MLKKAIAAVAGRLGYETVRAYRYPVDFDQTHLEIIKKARPYTNTSNERIHGLIEATRFVIRNGIAGAFAECGVYKGGSMMVVALTLLSEGVDDRELYLFDTFAGMPAPGKEDVDYRGRAAIETFSQKRISDTSSTWVNASLQDVRQAIASTSYPMDRVHFIEGMVEDTIPETAPASLALLRLDTDWYQSTKHELVHLYPRVSPRGMVIVDDYGHFEGARRAVDEYFAENQIVPFLHRLDYTGRLILKEAA